MGIWSIGTFTLKAGRGDDFLQALRAAVADMEGALTRPRVFRDASNPDVFLTLTNWESLDAVVRFRDGRLQELLAEHADIIESAVPRVVEEVGGDG